MVDVGQHGQSWTAGRVGGACAVLLCSGIRARSSRVSHTEERVFRAFNDASDDRRFRIWVLMQAGSFGAIPAAAAVVGARRGWRRGALVGSSGTAVWLITKLVKHLVRRGRPADYLENVRVRGRPQSGLGYPSGHAAVALTLALTSTTRPATRSAAIVVAGIAAGGRLYTGAHLPLDVAGGISLGVIVGSIGQRVGRFVLRSTPRTGTCR